VNARQASVLRRRLSGRFPGSPVDVTADSDGARIVIEHADGSHTRVTTGDRPGAVLRAMLGQDPRAVDGQTPEGAA
jgi:hypothetical protein